jgi:uncharacterized protein (TIGR02266 family)
MVTLYGWREFMSVSVADITQPDTNGAIERRLGRFDLDVPIHLSVGGSVLGAVTRNISIGGMFVVAERPLAVGDQVTVRLSILDEADPIEIVAEVRWLRPAAASVARPAGMGLRFVEPLLQAAVFVRVLLRLERTWV